MLAGRMGTTVPLDVLLSIEAADGAAPSSRGRSTTDLLEGAAGSGALEARYRAYGRQQAATLLGLLPREAIRPLHREALAWAGESGHRHDPTEPLETLLAYCHHLLPLPPFEVWCEDLRNNPLAHAEMATQMPGSESAPVRPVTLAVRTVERGGSTWDAGLRVFAEEGVWRGYIVFRCGADGRRARTAHVFREDGPEELRRRFLDLAPATLTAFLRSSLP